MKSILAHDENLEKVFKKPYLSNSDFLEGNVSIVCAIYEMLKFELTDEKLNKENTDDKKQNGENEDE